MRSVWIYGPLTYLSTFFLIIHNTILFDPHLVSIFNLRGLVERGIFCYINDIYSRLNNITSQWRVMMRWIFCTRVVKFYTKENHM